MQTLSLKAAIMKAPPTLRDDIRCALIVMGCGTISLIAGYNTILFNLGLYFGTVALFLTRYGYQRLTEKKSPARDIYPAVIGIIIPSLTIAVLFVIRTESANFCTGMFLGLAFYNGLYLTLHKRSLQA
jgi:hypothetical protein